MVEAVIFDMDGVIIDSEPFYVAVEQEMFKMLGLVVTREEHAGYMGTKIQYMWDALSGKYDLGYAVDELTRMTEARYIDYIKAKKGMKPIDGLESLLHYLKSKGIKLAVASSSPPSIIEIVLFDMFGIKGLFDAVVSGDGLKNSKPAPDIFLNTAELLGVRTENCVVIEDSANGIRAAKAAGMTCIAYDNPSADNHQDLSEADYVVGHFDEIRDSGILRLPKSKILLKQV